TINSYIAKNENEQTRVREIATAFARAYVKQTSITVPGGEGGGEYDIGYQAIEIYAEDGFSMSDGAIANTVTAAIRTVRRTASVKVLTLENTAVILMKA
ncbi:MAG: hypothetical protein K2L88_01555, partial [Clostridiales bacterium]|nr:hypothetical protein [Clostridiales bacterium]